MLQQEGQRRHMPLAQLLQEEGLAQPLREVIMYALACIGTSQERPCTSAAAAAPAAAAQPGEHAPAGSAPVGQPQDGMTAGQAHASGREHGASPEADQPGGSSTRLEEGQGSLQQQQQRHAVAQASRSGRTQGNGGLVSAEEGLAALGQYLASAGRHATFPHS